MINTAWKVSVFGDFLICIFRHLDWIRRDTSYLFVFSLNAGKYRPEKLQIRTLFTQSKGQMNPQSTCFSIRASNSKFSKLHRTKHFVREINTNETKPKQSQFNLSKTSNTIVLWFSFWKLITKKLEFENGPKLVVTVCKTWSLTTCFYLTVLAAWAQ